jgi:transcriptional regulator with XRE-family HTH domain
MSDLGERLRKAVADRDIGELAARVGVTSVTLYRWLGAKFDPGIVKLSMLADVLDVSLAWLVCGVGPMRRPRARLHALLSDYAPIEYLGPQGGSDQPPIAFLESWLFGFLYGSTSDSRTLVAGDMRPPLLVEVPDDSMAPTLRRGALVLVDRSFGMPNVMGSPPGSVYDGIYALQPAPSRERQHTGSTHVVIRRVLYTLDGKMIVRCDNPQHPQETYETRKRPTLIGRAVWHADRI